MLLKNKPLLKWEIGSLDLMEFLLILKNITFGSDIKKFSTG